MKILHWILGISAALSLIIGVIFRIVHIFTGTYILGMAPGSLLIFTITCCLASIALSMIELTCKKNL